MVSVEQSNRILGLDIGGTHIRAGLLDVQNRLTHFVMESSVSLFGPHADPVGILCGFIRRYSDDYLAGELPAAVSIGFPSTINKQRTTVLSTPNLRDFNNIEVVGPMEAALDIPVFINRDVNLIMLSDMSENALDPSGIIVGCYFGTGLGNAVRIHGQLLTGKNGVAAELGHVPLYGVQRVCGCGNVGCMETIASGYYLEELNKTHYPGEEIGGIFTRHAGDEVIRQYVDGLAIPIAMEVNIFDPDYVILGGGVLQMADFPRALLLECIHRYARKPHPDENLEVVFSSGKQESGVIGAGMYAQEMLRHREHQQTGGLCNATSNIL